MTSEEVIVTLVQGIFDQGRYQETRNVIKEKHEMLQSDEVKLKLLKLWEESLYQEFSLAKQSVASGNGNGNKGDSCGLSSSMRYKLRKKHPCPIELEQELRVKNARLPKVVHDGLNAWLKSHKENPYPNKRDKDLLSTKLGITPQQVNRWFIQRRKMIRLRGVDYVGRFDSPLDDYPHDAYMEDEDLNSNDSYDGEMNSYHNHEALSPPSLNDPNSSSLLKSILTVNQTSNSSHPLPLGLSSGGTVQVMDNIKQNISRLLISEENILTPPPSISGDSTARATPSDFPLETTVTTSNTITLEQREALDLSVEARNARLQSYKMDHSDMPTSAESSARSSACSSPHKDQPTSVNLSLGLEEQIAVNALLTLSHGGL